MITPDRARRAARAAGTIVVAAAVAAGVLTGGTLLGLVLLAHGYPVQGAAVACAFAVFAAIVRSGVLPPSRPRPARASRRPAHVVPAGVIRPAHRGPLVAAPPTLDRPSSTLPLRAVAPSGSVAANSFASASGVVR